MRLEADDPRHGTVNGYTNYGCRCDRCRQAQNETMKAYRARGGDSAANRARSVAMAKVGAWVIQEHPTVWRAFLADARVAEGLPVEVGPRGNFTKPIAHGTRNGYQAERYRGLLPCVACLAAEREYRRRRRVA